MFISEIKSVAESAVKKKELLKESKIRYLVAAALAGMFVGFGMLLMCVIGGTLTPIKYPTTKLINAAAFSVALSLVIMAGCELFTGNNFVMTVGALEKRISWLDCILVWIFAYIGNLIGSIFLSVIFTGTGVMNDGIKSFILSMAETKMSMPVMQLITRGILCNVLVCLAVWCSMKMKSESGKLIMTFWCIFAFVTCGFEHSVANMTALSLALMIPHTAAVSFGGAVYNLAYVTLGNIIGGAVIVAGSYWFISRNKAQDKITVRSPKDMIL